MSETSIHYNEEGYTSPDFLANVSITILSSSKNPSTVRSVSPTSTLKIPSRTNRPLLSESKTKPCR
jgi:hypothetical protein